MRRLRVAIVIPGFPAAREEPGLAAVVDLVERLAAVHDVRVIALRHPPRRVRYELAGARVRALGLAHARGAIGRTRVLGSGIAAVLGLHRRAGLDLVHAMWADEPGMVATVAARLVRRPSVVSVMGGELVGLREIGYGTALGRGGRWATAVALRQASLVTAGSTYLREQILASHPDARVVLLPLGVDVDRFRPADVMPGVRTVLFVGSLELVKDPALMLRAFAEVAHDRQELRLRMVGSGSLAEQLEQLAATLGIRDRVDFAGQLPRSAMPDEYRAASVLCVTSRHEAQSMAAVEAAASGVPIVGSRVGVLHDLGEGAISVPVGDSPAFSRALADILDDAAAAATMGRAGRAVATERYDIERTAASLLEIYTALAGRAS